MEIPDHQEEGFKMMEPNQDQLQAELLSPTVLKAMERIKIREILNDSLDLSPSEKEGNEMERLRIQLLHKETEIGILQKQLEDKALLTRDSKNQTETQNGENVPESANEIHGNLIVCVCAVLFFWNAVEPSMITFRRS